MTIQPAFLVRKSIGFPETSTNPCRRGGAAAPGGLRSSSHGGAEVVGHHRIIFKGVNVLTEKNISFHHHQKIINTSSNNSNNSTDNDNDNSNSKNS